MESIQGPVNITSFAALDCIIDMIIWRAATTCGCNKLIWRVVLHRDRDVCLASQDGFFNLRRLIFVLCCSMLFCFSLQENDWFHDDCDDPADESDRDSAASEDVDVIFRLKCVCKSTCQRSTCPCKAAASFCTELCKCGTKKKPCKNQVSSTYKHYSGCDYLLLACKHERRGRPSYCCFFNIRCH